ncbi:MAG: TIGR03986 family CRISPR-associated RAMP protein [Anaerolineales bacterium]|nr:TIGR03986 family CRISPR-associated RAMP protein [Anaerolineales bacterium]
MIPKHTNPARSRAARAPYNFIPLPEKVVTVDDILSQDTYIGGYTGWIDCTLETCSPTYIRGMMTKVDFQEQGRKKPDDLTVAEKVTRAPFFASSEAELEGRLRPVIPGSSLRGMVRQLVEIVGYGRMRWVADAPTITYRAVADPGEDPLKEPYKRIIGNNARNVRAGYLVAHDNRWFIVPAASARDLNLGRNETYLKIKDSTIQSLELEGYLPFDDINYHPQLHRVSFNATEKEGRPDRNGKRRFYVDLTQIVPAQKGFKYWGYLVCAGNMLETGQESAESLRPESPRKRQTLVFPPKKNSDPIPIPHQVIADYLSGLTPFQKESLSDWSDGQGCLKHMNPVFYVLDEAGKKVIAFGHSPNFRLPSIPPGQESAATPADFLPERVVKGDSPDLADGIFGWVEEQAKRGITGGLKGQRAGRVFFSDAYYTAHKSGVWYETLPITPHVLAGPKPTTFQHYLVQDREKEHEPNMKGTLAHYGTARQETEIRGYKMYWRRGDNTPIKADDKEEKHESQLTRMIPLKSGVSFAHRIWFDNLSQEELGALLWALQLPGEEGQHYCHQIGMGKPLGMGVVKIKPVLYLTQRPQRYQSLFADNKWEEHGSETPTVQYIQAFARFILKEFGHNIEDGEEAAKQFAGQERIQMLLAMLTWREGSQAWLEQTRYMEIRHGDEVNEYKERLVLPDPIAVSKQR